MTLPNFLIIGAQKSGTTWLGHMLRQHPDVFMPEQEVHFFDKENRFAKGITWYERHFDCVKNETAIGEKTPDYYWANGKGVEGHLPNVHLNIYNTLPNIKLIIVLRNPVERAISAVNHIVRSGRISPFEKIDGLLFGYKQYLIQGHGVIDYGKYYSKIMAYLEYFEINQLLILIFEDDIIKNPSEGLIKVCNFLNIDCSFHFFSLKKKQNASKSSWMQLFLNYYLPYTRRITGFANLLFPLYKPRPNEHNMKKLYEIYKDENEKLYNFLGHRISSWESTF
ncbi:sulfotransferase domain-containing protein [Desulfococcaceae bacterium HSG7]|nr:sulfotransferase domain-containing protein [Desulfococcaceae bacterium HSG7]